MIRTTGESRLSRHEQLRRTHAHGNDRTRTVGAASEAVPPIDPDSPAPDGGHRDHHAHVASTVAFHTRPGKEEVTTAWVGGTRWAHTNARSRSRRRGDALALRSIARAPPDAAAESPPPRRERLVRAQARSRARCRRRAPATARRRARPTRWTRPSRGTRRRSGSAPRCSPRRTPTASGSGWRSCTSRYAPAAAALARPMRRRPGR